MNNFMKKLTELDLQNALDECELLQFKSHGDWLAGMIKRLNATLMFNDCTELIGNALLKKKVIPPIKTVVKTGNSVEPEVPCKT